MPTSTSDKSIVIDTKAGLAFFRLLQIKGALGIEVSTGLRNSHGSVMKLAKEKYGCKGNTKKAVYDELCKIVDDAIAAKQHAARR